MQSILLEDFPGPATGSIMATWVYWGFIVAGFAAHGVWWGLPESSFSRLGT
jgi:hypothetical protein